MTACGADWADEAMSRLAAERTARRLVGLGFIGAAAVLALFMLAACASPQTFGRGGAFCDVERPIVLSRATIAAMSEREIDQALAHNRHGERECGWRKPAPLSAG